jgi:hypothetical protein
MRSLLRFELWEPHEDTPVQVEFPAFKVIKVLVLVELQSQHTVLIDGDHKAGFDLLLVLIVPTELDQLARSWFDRLSLFLLWVWYPCRLRVVGLEVLCRCHMVEKPGVTPRHH